MAKDKTKKEEEVILEDKTPKEEVILEDKTPKVGKKEVQTVELKKEDYDKLMAQLEKNAKDIDLLYKASDKHRMAKAMNENGEILVHTVKIWTWDDTGKIIVGTNLVSNRCEVVQGRWIEEQSIAFVLEDGEVKTVPYLEFVRKTLNKIPAEIVSTTKEQEGNKEITFLKVLLPNGKTLKINSTFVN